MIFNKVNHHELSRHFFFVSRYVFKCRLTWLHSASFQPVCFRITSTGSGLCLQAARAAGFWVSSVLGLVSSNGCLRSPTPPSHFLSSTDSFSVNRWLEWGLMAGLRGFASHGSRILSRGWLAAVEAPGYPRHPPSTQARQQLTNKFCICPSGKCT